MATYEETNANSITNFFVKEHPIYGSSRVGLDKNEIDLILVETPRANGSRFLGNKFYELNNHLVTQPTLSKDSTDKSEK